MTVHSLASAFLWFRGTILQHAFVFWLSASVVTCLRTAVVWEVLRHVFPRGHPFRPAANWVSLIALAATAAVFWYLGPEGNIFVDLERKMSLAAGAWLVLILVLGFLAGASSTRPDWAMAVGLGIVASVSVLNHASLELFPGFLQPWSKIRQFDFLLLMAIWTWGFWHAPAIPGQPETIDTQQELSFWRKNWKKAGTVVRDSTNRV